MLVQFAVENLLSFRDRVVLSMVPAPGEGHDPAQLVNAAEGTPLLRVAAVYGANASGKSNLVKALHLTRSLVARGVRPGEALPALAFKLRPGEPPPSQVEWVLELEGRRWAYGLVWSALRVEAEWLYVTTPGRPELLVFEREATESPRPSIRFGPGFRAAAKRKRFVEFVAEGTRAEQPFLSECLERNVDELGPTPAWFREPRQAVMGAGMNLPQLEDLFADNVALLRYAEQHLEAAGTGVQQLALQVELDEDAVRRMEDAAGGQRPLPANFLRQKAAEGRVHLVFRPRREVELGLSMAEQSDGTVRLLNLSLVLYANERSELSRLYVLDELEHSLHPHLTRYFLEQLLQHRGPQPVQLIFTTHDSNLLDLGLLPRDSIWFAEKDVDGASTLHSLAEFKGEQLDQLVGQLERGYLAGRFGGVPHLRSTAPGGASE